MHQGSVLVSRSFDVFADGIGKDLLCGKIRVVNALVGVNVGHGRSEEARALADECARLQILPRWAGRLGVDGVGVCFVLIPILGTGAA